MPRGREIAARARAARAYADLDQPALAKALSVSVETYARVDAGTRIPDDREMDVIAAATNVPRAFFDSGFAIQAATGLERRIAVLEAQISRLLLREAGELPPPPGELGHRLRGGPPSGEGPRQSGSEPEADAQ